MNRMAVKLNVYGSVSDVAPYPYSYNQKSENGWVFVEEDLRILKEDIHLWTVRQSDNVLVHKSTGLTPEEESQKSATEMTNILMGNAKDIEDIKQSITALTSMQLGGN